MKRARRNKKVTTTAEQRSGLLTIRFEAISIESGLLSPDWLARVAQLKAGGQSEADYRILKGLHLRDEIGRYWRIAQALWNDFAAGQQSGAEAQSLSERFLQPLLRESFGFSSLTKVEPQEIDDRIYPIGFAALEGRVPVVIAPAGSGLDTLAPSFGESGRRRSAFGLCQELLNAEDNALWGLATDGMTMRILRDNASLTRPAWIEADLASIFTEERYADFAALWLLAHETRFGRPDQPVTECSLEAWREAGREQGTRAREHLRNGVEDALVVLGQGFLSHPENQLLRTALTDGSLTKTDFFQELLRLAYRLIFLLTVEERGVLHPDDSHENARKLYSDGYSLRRLRDRSIKRSAHDRFHDRWEAVKIVFRGLARGEPRLALPALVGIFAQDQCPRLDNAKLENRALLLALFRLSWLRETSGLSRVNWRDMGPEELGSVYESLLELVPQITQDGRSFSFASGAETKGHARKTTGSYYTPDSLVQVLLDSALEPVVENTISAHPDNPVEALLELSIVDPACGSGHFLLAAARRLAAHVARLRIKGTPSAAEYRSALRQVVGRCIYGVDLNPMAVELCKVSLWMEAVEPGLPLSFLDSHIRHGNALLGTTPELMENGVPDDAWKPIEGDDKKIAGALRKRNKKAAGGQRGLDSLWSEPPESESHQIARAIAELEATSDKNVEALSQKESKWKTLLDSEAYRHKRFVADTWCSAFVWPMRPGPISDAAPTNEIWLQIRDRQGSPPRLTEVVTNQLAERYKFFHWHISYPQIFAKGGFDVVVGNPPWERLKFQDNEWFASIAPELASIPSAHARAAAIKRACSENPTLATQYKEALRDADGVAFYIRSCGRYQLVGGSDLNTYALFSELAVSLYGADGYIGLIVPSAIASTLAYIPFISQLVRSGKLTAFLEFENKGVFFPQVHNSYRFCLLTVRAKSGDSAICGNMLHSVTDLRNHNRTFVLRTSDLSLFAPNTNALPSFQTRADALLVRKIYSKVPVLVNDLQAKNAWGIKIYRMIDANEDSHLLLEDNLLSKKGIKISDNYVRKNDEEILLRVYEGKMIDGFNHRYASSYTKSGGQRSGKATLTHLRELQNPSFSVGARYWIPLTTIRERLPDWHFKWLLSFMDVCSATNVRTMIPAIIPLTGATKSLRLLRRTNQPAILISALCANLGSIIFDYVVRQCVSGLHLSEHIVKQLPVLPPDQYEQTDILFLVPRVLELTYTAWDVEPFARDIGYSGPPFRWDPERRFLLRAELDAAFFHLYKIERSDVDYIMDTFPIVRKNDEKAHEEYRTKRVILEIYDEMAEAIRSGQPYQTRLEPPPADQRVAHPPREKQTEGAS